mgnify:CR=1 FL=1
MSKYILFGAGVYAKKYKALLEYLHLDFDFFTDNDPAKWGITLYGKPVISPDEMTGLSDCKIIISSTHEIAIKAQLEAMGLSDRIMDLKNLYELCEQQMEENAVGNVSFNAESTILVDMYEGIGWGGSELWAANLAYGLHNRGVKSILLGGTEQPLLDDRYESLTIRFSEQETIMQMVNLLEANLPCVFVNNFAGCAYMAAIIVKRKYPNLIRIISVIHNDNKSLFDAHMILQEYIDKVFCVSNQIKTHMRELYNFRPDCFYFKEQPIPIEQGYCRKWNSEGTVQIGYAARLVRQQKRADLLVDLIAYLESKNLDYVFNIAGEGECASALIEYVRENKLDKKVCLWGRQPKEKMPAFWKMQDIFVNISEYEGTSLSMLEAMSYACVPITTDVSGAAEFIEEDVNGYICKVGDIGGVASGIEELIWHREKLRTYGQRCRGIIQERCNPGQYIDYWMKYILEL